MDTTTWLQTHRPAVERLLAEHWGVRGELSALVGERDRNLRVAADRPLLLKLMHAGCEPGLVDLQAQVLEHLAARAPALPLQRLVRTRSGALQASLRDRSGNDLCAWVVTFEPGRVLAEVRPRTAALRRELGALLARTDRALLDFSHPWLARELKWDLRRAGWIAARLDAVADPARRALLRTIVERFAADWSLRLERLRRSAIHGDGNDQNLLLQDAASAPHLRLQDAAATPRLLLLDFGDLHRGALVGEVAVAAAYALLDEPAPFAALGELVAAYDRELPLHDDELALLWPLVLTRLAVSVVNAALERQLRPGDPYVSVHEDAAWRLLERCHAREPREVEAIVRAACGRDVVPHGTALTAWLRAPATARAEVLGPSLPARRGGVLDLSFDSTLAGDDPDRFEPRECERRLARELEQRGVPLGIGRYGEPRPIYPGPAFGSLRGNGDRRTVHLGIDLFAPAGTPVHAPLAGDVVRAIDCQGRLDYGGMVVLRHEGPEGRAFGTLYGHLDPHSIAALRPGQRIAQGEAFAHLGAPPHNGDWPPHLHLQLLADDPAHGPENPPGVADPDEFRALAALYPDPSPLLSLDATAAWSAPSVDELHAARRAHFAPNLKLSYRAPLALVRGQRHFLWDQHGRRHLDAYNNVPHVGHAHPRVVASVQRQFALLATNTRYLHAAVVDYAARLKALLPNELSVVFLTASGSEANELALRLCRAHTGRSAMLVMEHGYHGHTTGTMDVSPYKFRQPGGGGRKDWVHESVQPDVYRGEHRGRDAGERYAASVRAQLDELAARGERIAGYLCECLPSVGGQLVLPDGFLRAVYAAVRAHGGLCIADDVQTALGRTGAFCFGFEQQQVVPDVLVLGKPLGGGFPLGAVVTTAAVAASFARGPEFFSTFGGNTVAAAAGLAVLDVLRDEGLQPRARAVGERLLAGLRDLQREHAVIGCVRGMGLFVGVDLVTDRDSRAPATAQARYVVNRLRDRRVLIGTDGPFDNVLKVRPPMTFDDDAADVLLDELRGILREDSAQPDAR